MLNMTIDSNSSDDMEYQCTPEDHAIQALWDDIWDYMDNIKQSNIDILMINLYKLIQRFDAINITDYRKTYKPLLKEKYDQLNYNINKPTDLVEQFEAMSINNSKTNWHVEVEKLFYDLANSIVG